MNSTERALRRDLLIGAVERVGLQLSYSSSSVIARCALGWIKSSNNGNGWEVWTSVYGRSCFNDDALTVAVARFHKDLSHMKESLDRVFIMGWNK